MAELVCYRPMWATLTAAGTTFLVFVTFNWNRVRIPKRKRKDRTSFMWPFVYNTVSAIAMPLLGLYQSVQNLVHVWEVRSSLASRGLEGGPCDSILTLCPLYIRIPRDSQLGECVGLYEKVDTLPDLHPLELQLDARPTRSPPSGAEASRCSTSQPLLETKEEDAPGSSKAEEKDVPGSLEVPERTSTREVPETTSLTTCQFALDERAALVACLASGRNAPSYVVLASLRERHWFRSVVACFQALSYILNVIQRITQNVAVSPIEAILTFISVLILLQAIIDLFVCGDYQRSLLLRLTKNQVLDFVNTQRDNLTDHFKWYHFLLLYSFWILITVLALVISFYYCLLYLHPANVLCSLSAMFFFISVIIFAVIIFWRKHQITIVLVGNVMFFLSVISALISTAIYWVLFQEPSSWLL